MISRWFENENAYEDILGKNIQFVRRLHFSFVNLYVTYNFIISFFFIIKQRVYYNIIIRIKYLTEKIVICLLMSLARYGRFFIAGNRATHKEPTYKRFHDIQPEENTRRTVYKRFGDYIIYSYVYNITYRQGQGAFYGPNHLLSRNLFQKFNLI